MISVLENQKEDLKFLHNQPLQIFGDFCKLVWNYLHKGANMKLYQAASQKLEVDAKQIQSGVEALAYLFIEANKYQLNEEGFKQSVISLGLPEDSSSFIYNEYLSQQNVINNALPLVGIQHPEFKDLEWRFETQISSRAIKSQIQPRIILKLNLEKGGETNSICLQSDIPNIVHMNQVINQALQESRTHHSKKIQRTII